MADNPPSPAPPNRVYQDIENKADLYPPGVYDLLTFQRRNWVTSGDPLSEDFIPLTDVQRWSPKNAKVFVIGLIPPSANVTGFTLDRSATVAAVKGYAEEVDVNMEEAAGGASTGQGPDPYIVTAPGYQFSPASGPTFLGAPIGPGAVALGENVDPIQSPVKSPAEMYDLFSGAYKKVFGRDPTPTEMLFIVAQSKRETSGAWYNNNPGFIHAGKGSKNTFRHNNDTWQSYASPQEGAEAMVKHVFGNRNVVAAAQAGDAMGYMTTLAQTGYMGESINMYYSVGNFPALLKEAAAGIAAAGGPQWTIDIPRGVPNACAYKEDIYEYRKRAGWSGKNPPVPQWVKDQGIDARDKRLIQTTYRFTKYSLYDSGCELQGAPPPDDANGKAASWAGEGAASKNKAAKDASKKADKDLNQSELGLKLQSAQKDYIRALQISIDQMRLTPPLRLLVNPISFKPSTEKIIADGSFGRNGNIVEHWGEQQMKIAANGKLAGFYALDVSNNLAGSPGNGPGINRTARNFSESYQNFLSLYLIYRNNGTIWLENTFAGEKNPKANNLALVGSVYIYYDNVLYIGSFDSFNVNEAAETPFTLEYDFNFTVRYKFDLDSIPDPREFYGNVNLNVNPGSPDTTSTQAESPDEEARRQEATRIQYDAATAEFDKTSVFGQTEAVLRERELRETLAKAGAPANKNPVSPSVTRVIKSK